MTEWRGGRNSGGEKGGEEEKESEDREDEDDSSESEEDWVGRKLEVFELSGEYSIEESETESNELEGEDDFKMWDKASDWDSNGIWSKDSDCKWDGSELVGVCKIETAGEDC